MLCALCEMRCEKDDLRGMIDMAQKSEKLQMKLLSGKRKRPQFLEVEVYDAVRSHFFPYRPALFSAVNDSVPVHAGL